MATKLDNEYLISTKYVKQFLCYVDESNGCWNGCYLYEDIDNEDLIRAGSMAGKGGFTKRNREHQKSFVDISVIKVVKNESTYILW